MPMDPSRYPSDWPAISRRVRDAAGWRCQRCGISQGSTATKSGKPVVLTVAHVGDHKHDKMRTDHLEALCQRCHLAEDMDDHVRNAAITRRRKRLECGQLSLIGETT